MSPSEYYKWVNENKRKMRKRATGNHGKSHQL